MNLLVLDNYDSFTYNIVHYIKETSSIPVDVYRNTAISLEEIAQYDKILLSPGPGIPTEAGIMLDLIQTYGSSKHILGVCLGHQAIVEAYGGEIYNMKQVYHGIESTLTITDTDCPLYKNIPQHSKIGRYHSWNAVRETLPDCFVITGEDEDSRIMSIRHKTHAVFGVQYHPESILTPEGKHIISNWLHL
ncbi:MAG: aminodeoxychorismate/anthranilate synthase component II [Bacteroidales bacterium]|jgi:anthranilate synthase component 2|nr:aminodeoxychorismate/anthranilate synthase component II [Bacteroidales bacterium]